MARFLDEEHMTTIPADWSSPEASAPLPAWRPDFEDRAFDGPFARAVRAAYMAHDWILQHGADFPILGIK